MRSTKGINRKFQTGKMVKTTETRKKGTGYPREWVETDKQEKELQQMSDKRFDDLLDELDEILIRLNSNDEELIRYFIEGYFDEYIIEDSNENPDLESKEIIKRGKRKFGPIDRIINIIKERKEDGINKIGIPQLGYQ